MTSTGPRESLWLIEEGRRLLSQRSAASNCDHEDINEHREIAAAVAEGRVKDAGWLIAAHVRSAMRHWKPSSAKWRNFHSSPKQDKASPVNRPISLAAPRTA